VVGRVCMDMLMVDVTEIAGVSLGDDVILIGKSINQKISAEDVAEWANTINYEITTGISYRVPRIYSNES
jgi:alanine racemase